MKKVISVVLTLLMLFSLCSTAVFAIGDIGTETSSIQVHSSRSQVPVIRILGDGEPLYNEKQEKIFHIRSMTSGGLSNDDEDSDILGSVANILLPFLIDGLLNDEWDAYYENLQNEISEIFSEIRLDNNGEVSNNTGISQARKDEMARYKTEKYNNDIKKRGYYQINDYRFWYDWRLDPIYTAELLHEHIQTVKKATGCDKVSIMASCLGTIVTTAYITKYGTDDLHGVGFTGAVSGGAEALSEAISGKFDIDGYAISRTLIDSDYVGEFNVDEFITASIDLVTASGALGYIEEGVRDTIYAKLVEGVTSALALSTLFTFPTYWAAVSPKDYDDAMLYVFGPEGSEKRTTYAGLIEKIEAYNSKIRENYNTTITSIGANGVKFGAVSKYGFQILPICESYDVVSDQFVSVNHSSFGATTSTIFDTLSDEYIQGRIAEDPKNADYISPDKKVDASTCAYPESTWFMKNVSHSEYTTFERKLLYDVITADKQITCGDTVDGLTYSRFLVYDYETDIMATMTEENCNTENWVAEDKLEKPEGPLARVFVFLRSLFNWFISLFDFINKK